jgi:hypothetical protein
MSTERPVPTGDTPASVCHQPNGERDTCGKVDSDAARMVVSPPTEATVESQGSPDLPPAARALLRLVRQAQQRAAARSTKGAA